MGLISPWFLGGALAVGLPVWLHLLKRHKTDPKLFPSLMFWEQREQSSVLHKRLDYILLFILRTAMLVLLALLFANPFINFSTPKALGKKIVVVAVDNSFSMRARQGTETRLDRAKREAQSLLSGVPGTTAAQVLALGGRLQAMTQQSNDPAELKTAVAAIVNSDGRASFGEFAQFLRTLNEQTKTPIEAHLFSDLQKSGLPPGFADLRLDLDTTLTFHPVGGDLPNYTVENVVAPRRVYDPKRVRIIATVAGFTAPAAKKNVSLVLNGKVVQSKEVQVPENGRVQAEFLGLEASYGFNKCEIRVDGADALPGDDRFVFSVERTDPKKILFVDDGGRAPLYFRAALDSDRDAPFSIETVSSGAAAGATLSKYALVVLSNPGALAPALEDSLTRYVSGGAGVLIALGRNSAAAQKVPLTGDKVEASSYAPRDADRFMSVTDVDTGHTVMASVEKFDGVRFFQAVRVTPDKSQVLAKLSDQSPLVLERKIGEGKVMVLASPLDNTVNDLPLHAAWVPFVQKSALYLGGGGIEQPVNVAVDSYAELRSEDGKGSAAEVLDPDGKRVLTLQEATTLRAVQLNREGFYDIKTSTGRQVMVAAHVDRRESDTAAIPQETLDLWKGTGTAQSTAAGGANPSQANDLKKPWSLFPILILLLIAVSLAESMVANRYLKAAESGAGSIG